MVARGVANQFITILSDAPAQLEGFTGTVYLGLVRTNNHFLQAFCRQNMPHGQKWLRFWGNF
jgi:hypothetical protein